MQLRQINAFYIFFSLTLIAFNTAAFQGRLNQNEYRYFSKILNLETEYSAANWGLEHSFFYELLVKPLHNLFGDSLNLILQSILIIWFLIICLKFFEIFKIEISKLIIFYFLFFTIFKQTLFGESYMFGTTEPKSFSYLFIITSIYFFLTKQRFLAVSLYSFSIIFHFGVTVASFPIIIYFLLAEKNKMQVIKYASVYFVLFLPLIIYFLSINSSDPRMIITDQFLASEYFIIRRHPHHLMPFMLDGTYSFKINPLFKRDLLITIIVYIAFFFFSFKKKLTKTHLNKIIAYGIIGSCTYLIFVYFFPLSRFVLIHPFRINSFIVFFLSLFVIKYTYIPKEIALVASIAVLVLSTNTFQNIREENQNNKERIEDVIHFIKEQNYDFITTPRDSKTNLWWGMEYETAKPIYAIRKFVPFNLRYLPEWELRLDNIGRYYSGDCEVFESFNVMSISTDKNFSCGKLIFYSNGIYIFNN